MAGVKIDLIVRGMCCLRPQVSGISDNIQVISVIGRFLEHSRVYYFQNSQPNVFCSSADWMERNLSSRIEVCFPILKRTHASRILEELSLYLRDEVQKWTLTESGNYISENENYKYSDGVQNKLLEILDHR
jgi:polyphosphate kinase